MASFNRVILIGNVTRDIELRHVGNGFAVCELGLAVNDRKKNQAGEWIEETTFVDVTLWGRQAEVASQYLSKGAPVFIEGRLKLDTWEKDGQRHSKLRVVGEKLQLLPKGDGSGRSNNRSSYSQGSSGGYNDYDQQSYEQRPAPRQSAPPQETYEDGMPQEMDDDVPF